MLLCSYSGTSTNNSSEKARKRAPIGLKRKATTSDYSGESFRLLMIYVSCKTFTYSKFSSQQSEEEILHVSRNSSWLVLLAQLIDSNDTLLIFHNSLSSTSSSAEAAMFDFHPRRTRPKKSFLSSQSCRRFVVDVFGTGRMMVLVRTIENINPSCKKEERSIGRRWFLFCKII
jgi:hypothetical protein